LARRPQVARRWCLTKPHKIEAARVAMTSKIKRGGKVWINVIPESSSRKKPLRPGGLRKAHPRAGFDVVKPGRVC